MLTLLGAGYLGYGQAFEWLARRLDRAPSVPLLPFDPSPSRSAREAQTLAVTAFGPGHWATRARIRYYDSYKGYWIFADDYRRLDEGKRYEFRPFALIWRERAGQALKTVTSQRAAAIFNQAPDMARGAAAEQTRVVRARIEGDVQLRDDKATPLDPSDDLTIALTDLDYDEATETISSQSRVVIRDRDAFGSGEGLVIELRPTPASLAAGSATGYAGARAVRLLRQVRIHVADVGQTGLIPGAAAQPPPADPATPRSPRPGEITCEGELRIDLPEPRATPPVGPPPPQGPTFAHFARNVRIRQGDPANPEQIDCDRLHLTLRPGQRPSKPQPASSPSPPTQTQATTQTSATEDSSRPIHGGPVSDLVLESARATGHAVWLQSPTNRLIARGNELVYRHDPASGTATTYLRGDRETEIRKENPAQETLDVIRTVDVTLYHSGPTADAAAIVARGPGWLETRELAEQSILRTARWHDQVIVQPVDGDPSRRQLTLLGDPEIRDLERGTMTARGKIVASLVSKPKGSDTSTPPAATPPAPATAAAGGAFRIELLQAWDDVTLIANAPEGQPPGPRQAITAREWLGVVFEEPSNPSETDYPTPPASTPADSSTPPAPTPTPAQPVPPTNQAPPPPPIQVEANRIWAWIGQADSAKPVSDSSPNQPWAPSAWEVRQVRLRGSVLVHQDPPPQKRRGLDVSGEEVDLIHLGSQHYEVRAYGTSTRPARARTDGFQIEGPVLGLDQEKHYACVIGPGKLIQENAGGGILGTPPDSESLLPTRFDPEQPPPNPPPAKTRGPLTIAWGRDPLGQILRDEQGQPIEAWMKFYGKPIDERGQPGPAKVQFHNGVRAWTNEAILTAGQMWAYLDRPVDFQNSARSQTPLTAQASPTAQIDRVVCERDVTIVTRTFDPTGNLTEKRRVEGQRISYERVTNRFQVESAGVVHLYDRGQGFGLSLPDGPRRAEPMATPGRDSVRPVAFSTPPLRDDNAGGLPPLKLTSIWFDEQMVGQLASTPQAGRRVAGQAEFFGNPRVMHGVVADEDSLLDPDRPPRDYLYAVSRTLRVISEPPDSAAPAGTPDRILIQAWGDVFTLAGRGGRETAIQASDHLDYNSETGLAYIYGGETGVTIVDQTGTGQPASYGRGSTVVYNHRTGQHRLLDARTIQLVDPRSGVRTGVPPAPPATRPRRPQRDPFPRPSGADKERRNFIGR
jgi:hypothetical protein